MPVPLSNFKEMLKIAFKQLIDICMAEDIRDDVGKRFVVFSQRSIHKKDQWGTRQTVSNYDCIVVGEIAKLNKEGKHQYMSVGRVPYLELPSGKLRNLAPGNIIYIFPDDILEAILFNDYLDDIGSD